MNLSVLGILLGSYLLGTLSPAFFLGKFYGVDLRKEGSGNLGATNVFRLFGWRQALVVFTLDFFKGFFAVFLSQKDLIGFQGSPVHHFYFSSLCGSLAILGHTLSPWVGWRGGKGIATSFGVLTFLMPEAVGLCFLIFLALLGIFKYVSLASIGGAIALPFINGCLISPSEEIFFPVLLFSILLSSFILFKHRTNIIRLRDGSESRINFSSPKSEKPLEGLELKQITENTENPDKKGVYEKS